MLADGFVIERLFGPVCIVILALCFNVCAYYFVTAGLLFYIIIIEMLTYW